jgi:alkanesulfonate monooxygenase SsuD/methylene tetrahydromethanopterin reductase-like flavin-dependent oxidoreductase (luciferase family)
MIKVRAKRRRPTDDELLEELRALWTERGKLSASLLEASPRTRPPVTYIRRFGSLPAAYALIGYESNARQKATSVRFGKPRSPRETD